MKNEVPIWLAMVIAAIGLWTAWEMVRGLRTGRVFSPIRIREEEPYDRSANPLGFWLSISWCGFVVMLVAMVLLAAAGIDVRFWL